MFGEKGARCVGAHRVVLAPGPGWHHMLPSGREAYVDCEYSSFLGLAVGTVIPRYWDGCTTLDLSGEEWRSVLVEMDRLVSSPRMERAGSSAFMRSMYTLQLEENMRRPKSDRVDEGTLSKWFAEKHRELLRDLRGWTNRALNERTVLRVAGL